MTELQNNCPKCGNKFATQTGGKSVCPKCLFDFAMENTDISNSGNPATGTKTTNEPILPEDTLIGQYKIISLLGRGGMGTVYKAHHPSLDRFVAIKILPARLSTDEEFLKRFNREAKTLATLSHPNIVAIYDMGKYDTHYYFVMEYVEGVTVRDLIGEHKLPPEEALKIVPQLCDALEYAHSEGIIHRDIKPENILIDKKGRVKIADFGLARIVSGDTPLETITKTQEVMGTYDYMSPEQRMSAKSVDHRSDIYSMGVVFYEMLTGELPIGKFEMPSRKAQIDIRLDEIVLKALENEPTRRYQKASELGEAVTRVTTYPHPEAQLEPTTIGQKPLIDYHTIRVQKMAKFLMHLGAYLGVNLFLIIMCLTGLMPWVIVPLVAGGWGIGIVINLFGIIIHRYYPTSTEKHSADLLAEAINNKIQQQIAEKSSSDLMTQKAQKTAKFLKHFGTYLVINIFLAFLDYITDKRFNWFYWVSACWGAFLALDFVDIIIFRSYPTKVPIGTQEAKHSGLAIASFVVGLIPLIITQILGIIFGIIAIRSINRSAGTLKGKGLAIAGIVISAVLLLCISLGISFLEKGSDHTVSSYGNNKTIIIEVLQKLAIANKIYRRADLNQNNQSDYAHSITSLVENDKLQKVMFNTPEKVVIKGYEVDYITFLDKGNHMGSYTIVRSDKLIAQADQGALGLKAKPYNGYFYRSIPWNLDANKKPVYHPDSFAFVAYPEKPDHKTYIVDEKGTIYSKNLGNLKYPDKWETLDYDPNKNGWTLETWAEISEELISNICQQIRKVQPELPENLLSSTERQAEQNRLNEEKKKQLAQSLEVAQTMKDERLKSNTMADIAIKYAQLGDYDNALKIASTIEGDNVESNAIQQITVLYVYTKPKSTEILTKALEIAKIIKDERIKSQSIADIAIKYAQLGDYDNALKIASTIEGDNVESNAIQQITVLYVYTKPKSTEILTKALEIAKIIKDERIKSQSIADIAIKYAQLGDYDNALKIASTIEGDNVESNAIQQITVLYVYTKPKSTEILTKALEIAKTIKDERIKGQSIADIAIKYAQLGDYDNALKIASTIEGDNMESNAIQQITVLYVYTKPKSTEILTKALEIAKTIKDERIKGQSIADIAIKYAQLGDYDNALKIASTIEGDNVKSNTIEQINRIKRTNK